MSKKYYNTFNLFKNKNSFLNGIGTVFNVRGNYFDYHYSNSAFLADLKALENDWGVVGNDIKVAITKVEKEKSKQLSLNFE